jgi:hypothetical protein
MDFKLDFLSTYRKDHDHDIDGHKLVVTNPRSPQETRKQKPRVDQLELSPSLSVSNRSTLFILGIQIDTHLLHKFINTFIPPSPLPCCHPSFLMTYLINANTASSFRCNQLRPTSLHYHKAIYTQTITQFTE